MKTILAALQKILDNHAWSGLLIGSCYLIILVADAGVIGFVSKDRITAALGKWGAWILKANFFLVMAGVVICREDIWGAFKALRTQPRGDRRVAFLAAVVLTGFVLACFAAPRTHRIYFDEDIYANVGQTIALSGQVGFANYGTYEYGEYQPVWTEYNKEPAGWPFLISLAFDLAGVNEHHAFLLNNLLFTGGILIVFFIAWELGAGFYASLFAAAVYAFIPHNALWANTAAAEPSAAFFTGLFVLCFIVGITGGHTRRLFLAMAVLPFASQMRAESVLISVWAAAAAALLSPRLLADRRFWALGLIAALFLSPHILHTYAVSGNTWGATGPKFSLEAFRHNIGVNGPYYLDDRFIPALFTILAIAGLIFGRRVTPGRRFLMLLWFLLFWGIFLFFYAGSYRYGADVRFALLSFMPLAVLSGIGWGLLLDTAAERFPPATAMGVVLVLMFLAVLGPLHLVHQVGQEAWGARCDHKYAEEFIKKIPRRSIVLTHIPTMLLLWEQSAIQTSAGINNPELIRQLITRYQGHVYFHYNFWCNVKNDPNAEMCRDIGRRYNLEEIAHAEEQDYRYGLYKVKLR